MHHLLEIVWRLCTATGKANTAFAVSMNKLALDLRVPVTRISEIVHERRGITADTALRLARYFNTTARFWLNLQGSYDLEIADDESSDRIEQELLPAARHEFSLT